MTASNTPTATPDPRLTVGTLTYTKAGLFSVFSWLLWGSLCFQLFESSGGPEDTLGLYLQHNYHVSNVQVNILFNLIPQLIGVFMTPMISFKSDRTRTRWGRRIPYIAFSLPFLCAFSVLAGFSDDFFRYFKTSLGPESLISPFTAAMLVIGVLTVGYTFFHEFVGSVYWYLFADVVPRAYLGRYMALFRTVGFAAGMITNLLIKPYQLTHLKAVHSGVALLYFIGFGLLCWRVKEGQYPPVTDVTKNTPFWVQVRLYFRECFTHPIFVLYYLMTATTVLARGMMPAGVFALHLSQHRGSVAAHASGPTVLAGAPSGEHWVSGGLDGQVCLWEPLTNAPPRLRRRLVEAGTPVRMLAVSPDGRRIAVGREKGDIDVLSVDGRLQQRLPGHDGGTLGLAFSPDGTRLATGGADGAVRFHGGPRDVALPAGVAHTGAVHAVAFSSDGTRVASVDAQGRVAVWLTESGDLAWVADSGATALQAVCFAPALERRPTTSHSAEQGPLVRLWRPLRNYLRDVFTNESLYDTPVDDYTRIIAPDGWVVVGGTDGSDQNQNAAVRMLDASDGRVAHVLKGHKQSVTALVYKSELRLVASGSLDGSVRLWDLLPGSVLANDQSVKAVSGYTESVTGLFSPARGPALATCSREGGIHSWDIDQGVSLRKIGVSGTFFAIVSLLLAYPFGALIDRFHPLRVMLLMTILALPFSFLSFYMIHDYLSGFWINLFRLPFQSLAAAAGIPLTVVLLPKATYGQMCSANALVRQLVAAIAGLLGALLMDHLTHKALFTDSFRYGFLIQGWAGLLTLIMLLLVYREWCRLGGVKGYVPPECVTPERCGSVTEKAQ